MVAERQVYFIGSVPKFTIENGHVYSEFGGFVFSVPLHVFRQSTEEQIAALNEHDRRKCRVVRFKGKQRGH